MSTTRESEAPHTGFQGAGHGRRRITIWEFLFLLLLFSSAGAAIFLESASGQISWPPFLVGLLCLATALQRPLTKLPDAERSWADTAVLVVAIGATHLMVWASGSGESALYAFYFLPILASAREYGLRGAVSAGLGVSLLYATFFIGSTLEEIEAELLEEIITLLFTSLLAGYLFEQIGAEQAARRQAAEARRLADIGLLAAQVAHEVRNPLQVIEGAAETIDARGWIMAEGRPFLDDLRRESRRMARVAGDFLAWGRPTIAIGETLSLRAICERAHHRADSRPDLVLRGEMELSIRVDEDAMERAFANLMQNASQAGAHHLTIEATALPEGIQVLVTDDGPGIPESLRGSLFEPFQSGRPGGTGLGLAIVRGIITGHAGQIEIASGRPATFRIFLPRVTDMTGVLS